jgi:DNA-binding Lrp family transcriptional regulator
MMMKAFVLINTKIGAIPAVIHNLSSIQSVKEVEMTFGEYDVIAVVKVDDIKKLANVISKEIQTIPDILRTTACMAVELE